MRITNGLAYVLDVLRQVGRIAHLTSCGVMTDRDWMMTH